MQARGSVASARRGTGPAFATAPCHKPAYRHHAPCD